jgi:hypothetical protein
MDQKFRHFGAMTLIGRRVEDDLHGADDFVCNACEDNARSIDQAGQDPGAPECAGIVEREWEDKANARAGIYGGMEHGRKLLQILL